MIDNTINNLFNNMFKRHLLCQCFFLFWESVPREGQASRSLSSCSQETLVIIFHSFSDHEKQSERNPKEKHKMENKE